MAASITFAGRLSPFGCLDAPAAFSCPRGRFLLSVSRTQISDGPRRANDASYPRNSFYLSVNRNKCRYVKKGAMKFAMMNRLGRPLSGNAYRANDLCASSNFWTSAVISGFLRFSLAMSRALLGLYPARIAARVRVPISRPLLEEPLVSSMRLHGHQSPRWHLCHGSGSPIPLMAINGYFSKLFSS